jgi:hypothetical protein
MPDTLEGLLGELQELSAAGACQEAVIERLYEIAAHYGLRVRHDQYACYAASALGVPPQGAKGEGAGQPLSPTASDPEHGQPCAEQAPDLRAAEAGHMAALAGGPAAPADGGAAGPGRRRGNRGPAKGGPGAPGKPQTPEAGLASRAGPQQVLHLPAPVVRHADGTHHLALGRLFDPAHDEQAAPVRGAAVGRLVLSCDRRRGPPRGRGAPLYYACNGLVLDARTWRALAVPPCAFNLRPSAKAVDPFLAEGLYDVIRADDGTVVTLYRWDHPTDGGVWALASSNGYDVSSLRWIGPRTYAEVVHDLAARLYPAFVAEAGLGLERTPGGETRLTFARLDPAYCYTLGFRHHDFHPVRADPERLWQIQCAHLARPVPRVLCGLVAGRLPRVPAQSACPLGPLALAAALGAQPPAPPDADAPPPPLTLAGLRALGAGAAARAAAYIASPASDRAPPAQASGPAAAEAAAPALPAELDYGYILRSREPARTREHSDLLIETPLLAQVRRIVYERAPRSVRNELTAADRLEYNALRAFLTAHERPVFLALCPEWEPRFRRYRAFVDEVVVLITGPGAPPHGPAPSAPAGIVAEHLRAHLRRHEALPAAEKEAEGIVRDYVMNPEYAHIFLRALARGPPV